MQALYCSSPLPHPLKVTKAKNIIGNPYWWPSVQQQIDIYKLQFSLSKALQFTRNHGCDVCLTS